MGCLGGHTIAKAMGLSDDVPHKRLFGQCAFQVVKNRVACRSARLSTLSRPVGSTLWAVCRPQRNITSTLLQLGLALDSS